MDGHWAIRGLRKKIQITPIMNFSIKRDYVSWIMKIGLSDKKIYTLKSFYQIKPKNQGGVDCAYQSFINISQLAKISVSIIYNFHKIIYVFH